MTSDSYLQALEEAHSLGIDVQVVVGSQAGSILYNLSSFSIADSIYSLFPQVRCDISEPTGLLTETRMFNIPGYEFDLQYQDATKVPHTLPCYVVHGETTNYTRYGEMNGTLSTSLEHVLGAEKFDEPLVFSPTAETTKSGTSSIVLKASSTEGAVQALLSRYAGKVSVKAGDTWFFPKKDSDFLPTWDILYSKYTNIKDFVDNQILPLSYVKDADPFYCFVNVKNELSFKDFESLSNQNTQANMKVFSARVAFLNTSTDVKVDSSIDNSIILFSFTPFSGEYDKLIKSVVVRSSVFEEGTDGSAYDTTISDIGSAYSYDNGLALCYYGSNGLIGWNNSIIEFADEKKKNRFLSIHEFARRRLMFTEHAVATTALNYDLCAGVVINVISANYRSAEGMQTENFTGKWVVESSFHTFTAQNHVGITKLFLGRVSTKAPEVVSAYMYKGSNL